MKIKKTALAILTLSMFAASSVMAAENSEISLNGSFDSGKNDTAGAKDTTTLQVIGSYGYYFMPQLVGRIVLGINDTDSGGGNKTTSEVYGVGAKYYFGAPAKGSVVPFAFGDVLALSAQSAGTTYSGSVFDAGGGIATFLTESVSFDVDAKYRQQSFSAAGFSVNNTGYTIDFGITARF